MIVTVTTNAALDRTLTVPVYQIGFRHRSSEVLTLAGGKGINVARALKLLEVPVVATGLAGGRTGTRIIEELTSEAILNDFVRIAVESAHLDGRRRSDVGHVHRDQRVGTGGDCGRLHPPLWKLRYLFSPRSGLRRARRLPAAQGADLVLRRSDPLALAQGRARRARQRGRAAEARRRGGAVSRPEPAGGRAASRTGPRTTTTS